MASIGGAVLLLAAVALGILALYLLYGLVFRAFRAVGFTQREATLILLGTFLGGWFDIPFAQVDGRVLAINVGGAVVPVVVSYLLLRRYPQIGLEATAGATVVAFATYLVTRATPEGIVSPFPLWLVPPLVAALMSLLAFWREETHAAPLAYVAGSIGALVGADVFRLSEFLAQPVPDGTGVASIGGAAVFDMVFLTGILAVGLDMLVFRERRRSGVLDGEDAAVFRTTTSSEFIRDYTPAPRPPPVGQAVRRAAQSVKQTDVQERIRNFSESRRL